MTDLIATSRRWLIGGFAATLALMAGIQLNAQAITGRTASFCRAMW